MSLFSSLQIANNALIAQQIGLQVTGNNVANANTPGYIRQQVLFESGATQQIGQLLLGSGVNVAAIVQKTDRYLAERVRGAAADLANGEAQEQTYVQLESIVADALRRADQIGVKGREITPFLLSQMSEKSGGRTLAANIALLENNAYVAAAIAVAS